MKHFFIQFNVILTLKKLQIRTVMQFEVLKQ